MRVADALLHGLNDHGAGERFAEAAASLGGGELASAPEGAARTRGRFQLAEAMIPRSVLSATPSRFVAGVKRPHAPAEAR